MPAPTHVTAETALRELYGGQRHYKYNLLTSPVFFPVDACYFRALSLDTASVACRHSAISDITTDLAGARATV